MPDESRSCCQVEAVISIDERGQMVLPKEIREKAGIQAGDKLAVVVLEKSNRPCCITLIKADNLSGMVKDLLSPVLGDSLAKEETNKGDQR